MDRRIVLSALMLIVLVSVIAVAPALQTSTEAVTATEESSRPTFKQRLMSLAEKLPESIKLCLTRTASRLPDVSLQTIESQSPGEPVVVGREETVVFTVDKNFYSVKPGWEVISGPPPVRYVADSFFDVFYYIDIPTGLDLGTVTLTDLWKTGMVWGTGPDIAKPYYLLYWATDIDGAGPANYNPLTGVLSITFDPAPGVDDIDYYIEVGFLAKYGFVNQFLYKPTVSTILSPTTTPPLKPGTFYNMWLRMKSFKVRGSPLFVGVGMEVLSWQSTANGVYVKNMDPLTYTDFGGADGTPGPASAYGEWFYTSFGEGPGICNPDPPLLEHWIQFGFQKSDVVPAPNFGNFLYDGEVGMLYGNRGFGIVIGSTPQLTLSPDNWNVWVTTGLGGNVQSMLYYYFQEPKPTILTFV